MDPKESVLAPPYLEAARPAQGFLSSSRVAVWLITLTLFALPLVTYWPTTYYHYGLRDDYSNLREAHEEPGKLVQFCASHARPIYGHLLQTLFRHVDTIHDLQWVRLFSVFLLGALSLATFRTLCRLGWPAESGFCVALWITLLPSAQVIAGWSIAWPYTVAALLALAAFFVAERALAFSHVKFRAVGAWAAAAILLAASALIYQPSTLFYAVPLAGGLVAHRRRTPRHQVHWTLVHVAFVCGALLLAYGTISAFYAAGCYVRSDRVTFEPEPWTKLLWFLKEPLPNTLSLFVINDDNHRDRLAYLLCALVVGALTVVGGIDEWRRQGRARGLIWFTGLFSLPVFAFAINLIAAERFATYRTVLSMAGVLLCFLVWTLHSLLSRFGAHGKNAAIALLLAAAALTARHRAFALLAVPQGNEWHIMQKGAARVKLGGARLPSVFAIEPALDDISTETTYNDEFGSLSTNSPWVPKEMFKRAMHDLHPGVVQLDTRYTFDSGPILPSDHRYDVVVDLRQLRELRTPN